MLYYFKNAYMLSKEALEHAKNNQYMPSREYFVYEALRLIPPEYREQIVNGAIILATARGDKYNGVLHYLMSTLKTNWCYNNRREALAASEEEKVVACLLNGHIPASYVYFKVPGQGNVHWKEVLPTMKLAKLSDFPARGNTSTTSIE